MADAFSKKERSQIMASVSSHDTKLEIIVRNSLFSKGFRFRKNNKRYPGKPDIVLPKYKTIVFIHGCFWHGHEGCKHSTLPTSNVSYWQEKIEKNIKRDEKNIAELLMQDWQVLTVWGCEIETIVKREKRLTQLIKEIKNRQK